jgi:hypothetical protein
LEEFLNSCQGGKAGANISTKSESAPLKQSQQQQQPNIPKQKTNVIKERNILFNFIDFNDFFSKNGTCWECLVY